MASLQRYSGKGRDAGKTFYRIQPVLPNGRRPTIRLGTGLKRAESACRAIGDLIDVAHVGNCVEASAKTKMWLAETADESICETLKKFGLIEAMPDRFTTGSPADMFSISKLADEYVRTRGTGHEASTITIYNKAKSNLIECFGDVDIRSLVVSDGREFWRWLQVEKNFAPNTAKQRLRYARAFFDLAIEDQHIERNPFKARGLSVTQSAAEKEYIPRATVDRIIDHCPTDEWKLLFALVRSIPARIPSEIQELTWGDVDWEQNSILIHSPKTRHLGKSARLVPIFDSLKPRLSKAFDDAVAGEIYVFPKLRLHTNLGKIAGDILTKAKLRVWPKFFNALRASTETDLMDVYGLRRACQWAGNSPGTAMKNYAMVRKTDFADAGNSDVPGIPKSDAKSDARTTPDAKSDAALASVRGNVGSENPVKKAPPSTVRAQGCLSVGVEGLEPPTLSV